MKKLLLIVVVVVILVGCSTVPEPRMIHSKSGSKYENYQKLLEEKRSVLLTFKSYPGYEVLVYSYDIKIFDYRLLGFIPIYRNLNVFIENNENVLLENIPQGIKVLYVTLIPKADNLSKTASRYSVRRKSDRRRGKIILNVGIGDNTIQITDPKDMKVQQIIHVEKAVSLKKGTEEKSFQSLEELMDDYDDFRRKARE